MSQSNASSRSSGSSSVSHDGMFTGNLDHMPIIPTYTVKLFVCSNKTDFEWERQKLWEDTLGELQQHCLPLGLDLILVDIHQESNIDVIYDRHTLDDYLEEIKDCHRTSIGPFFLGFVGNKYGPAPLPRYIEESEYQHLKREAFKVGKDVRLLQEWYIKDDNAVPPVYVLQSIASKYTHYHSRNASDAEERQTERDQWQKTFTTLQDILQHSTSIYHRDGNPNQATSNTPHPFFTSGLEQQVNQALELDPQYCYCVVRTIEDIPLDHEDAPKFVDISKGYNTINKEAHARLKSLKDRLKSRLGERNCQAFDVPWAPKGFDPMKYEEHAEYLENVHTSIITWLTDKVELHAEEQTHFQSWNEEKKKAHEELLCHFNHYQRLVSSRLHGLSELEDKLWEVVKENNNKSHQMILLHGPEGCGKSTFLSKWFRTAMPLLGPDTVLLFRYVGITPFSSTPDELLRSICTQINIILKKEANMRDLDEQQLVDYYYDLVDILAETPRNYLFVIDGLDKLKAVVAGTEMYFWDCIARRVPPNIHMITSFTSTPLNIHLLHRLSNPIAFETNILSVPSLEKDSLKNIIKDEFAAHQRQLTVEQEEAITTAAKAKSVPVYVRMLIQEGLAWTSQVMLNGVGLPGTLDDAVNQHFEALEEKYGEMVVSTIARYLSSARCGLTEMEMLDLLSCNNDVLLALYQSQMPFVLRFPHLLWMKIRSDLGIFLDNQYVDCKTVMMWSHATVASSAAYRYFVNTDQIKKGHRDIAELFLETWVGNKPLVVPDLDIQIIDTGCRCVMQQPLLYSDTRYNHRRLNELWFQLLHAGEIDTFKEHSFCNFEYLLARMHSTSAQNLIADFKTTCSQVLDAEVQILFQCLLTGVDILSNDPLQLANELIGRLRQIKDHYPEHIEQLVQQCMEWCDSYNLPLVVPLSSWLPDPRIPLVQSIDCPEDITKLCPTRNGQHLFCATTKNDVHMYHVPSKKLIKSMTGHRSTVTCLQMAFNNRFLITGSLDATLRVWDVTKGKTTQTIREHADGVLCLSLTHNDEAVVTGSKDRSIKVISLTTGEVIHTKKDHQGSVLAVVLNTTDTILASASADQTVKLWDLDDMTLLNVIEDSLTSPVTCMTLSCDNTFLLLACEDATLRVKSFTTGSDIHRLEGHKGKVESITLSNDCHHAAVGSSDGNIYIYNIRTTELLDAYSGHTQAVTSICTSWNQHFILSASKDKICVWTFYRCHTHNVLTDEHTKDVNCINIASDGKIAITGSKDKSVRLWHLSECWPNIQMPLLQMIKAEDNTNAFLKRGTGAAMEEQSEEANDQTSRKNSLIMDNDEIKSILVTQSRKGSNISHIRWDSPVSRSNQSPPAHVGISVPPIKQITPPPGENTRSSGAAAGEVNILSTGIGPTSRSTEILTRGHVTTDNASTDATLTTDTSSADVPRPISTCEDSTRTKLETDRIYEISEAEMFSGKDTDTMSLTDSKLDQDEGVYGTLKSMRRASFPIRRGSLWRESGRDDPFGGVLPITEPWDLRRKSHLIGWVSRASAATSGVIQTIDYITPADDISGCSDHVVKLWNLDICDFSADLIGHEGPVTSVALAGDEAFAVSGSEDKTVKVWSIMMGCVITDYKEHNSTISSVFVLSDNIRVMSVEEEGFIKLWKAEDGETLLSLDGPTAILNIAPNCQFAISGEGDNQMKMWSVEDGVVVQDITHTEKITCVAYSTDSQYVVTGSADMSLKVWEAATGKLTQVLVEHEDTVSCVAVTDSNRHVVSGSHDQRLLVWSLSTGLVERHLLGHTDHVTVVRATGDGTVAISGSKDGTLRVWNVTHGTLITTFDMHTRVEDLLVTDNAVHLVVKIQRSTHVPLLCLHNSPAGEVKSQSQISIQMQGVCPLLPLKPHPLLNQGPASIFPVPKRNNRTHRTSISSIPEIIKVSPIKAPIREVVRAQEHNKESREQKAALKNTTNAKESVEAKGTKKSGICTLL